MSHSTPDEANSTGEPALAPGSVVGEYELRELIGEGGFGSVYRAVHPLIGKSAAVKVLKQEFSAKPEMVARFISEARAVNQIRHRNIIDIFSFGKLDDGRQYYVMELLEGIALDRYLEDHGKLSVAQAIPVLKQLARALGAAHAAGITHRDIKPENVFLTFDEEHQPEAKLLDFGIAKLVVDNLSQHKTRSGVPMGTPLYMSPEQVHGRDVDPRSDIYSFGVLAFQVLTGQPPFTGETMMMVMMKQISEAAPAPSVFDPSLPAAIDAPILHMLEKEPDKRPESIVQAVEALIRAAVGAGVAPPDGATPARLEPLPLTPWALTRASAQTPGRATIAALEASDTLIASEAPRHDSAATLSGGAVRRPAAAVVAAVALLIGVLASVAFFMLRASPGALSGAPQALVASAASTTEALRPTPTVAISPVVSSAPSTGVPQATTIKLVVKASPADAEVWRGNTKIGRTGEEISLPREEQEIALTIKKTGFAARILKITPTVDIAEAIILSPEVKAPTEYGNF